MKFKKVELQNQALKNITNAKTKEVLNIDKEIQKDVNLTLIYIICSFLLLFIIKYLNLNLFFNKLF